MIDVVNETDWVLSGPGITTTGSGNTEIKWLNFHIDASSIKQGNAVIAVANSSGTIMWSWHLWITDYVPRAGDVNVYPYTDYRPASGYYSMMPRNLGWVEGSTITGTTVYDAESVYVRFVNESGSAVMTITRPEGYSGGSSTNAGHCPYYQWGRKDALLPSNGSGNTDLTCYGKYATFENTGSKQTVGTSIQNPYRHYGYGSGSPHDWCSVTDQNNWWFVGNTLTTVNAEKVIKSIYDPCPAGYHMPESGAFTGFTTTGGSTSTSSEFNVSGSFSKGWNFLSNGTGSPTIFFPAAGFRYYSTGALNNVGSFGGSWTAVPSGNNNGRYPYFESSLVNPQNGSRRSYGCTVRPVKDY
jgi:uncharacterized protein (TIGR02145 family)